MRLISYASASGPRAAGVTNDGGYVDLNQADPELPAEMTELLAMGAQGVRKAAAATAAGKRIDPATVRLLPPVPRPPKILCIGLNYADHARETGKEPPPEPVVFSKLYTALAAHGDPIILPRLSNKVDYEAELVVVIGSRGRHIPENRALDHVAAYTCGHDVSARDWQGSKPGGQWLLSKSFDSFAPLGPELVTTDEMPDPSDLRIQLRLNGQTMQDSRTSQLIFRVPALVSYISGVCTLEPGDLIFTGTPPGVGMARTPPVYLQPGDVAEVDIEGIRILRNAVTADK